MRRGNVISACGWGTVWIAGLLLSVSVGRAGADVSDADSDQSAAAEAAAKAERVRAQIRVIRATNDPHEAMTSYARGCTADRTNIGLHDVYLRRMLTFGLPQIAQYPARVLVGLDPANGLAWGVVAHTEGKSNRMSKAFEAAMRAAELVEKNPSVLHNAGQMVAWQERSGESAKLSGQLEARKKKVKKVGGSNKHYTKAYEKISAAYSAYNRLADSYEKKISTAESQYKTVESQASEIDRDMKRLFARVQEVKTRISRLWWEYHDMEDDPRWFPPDENGNISSYPINRRTYQRIRNDIRDDIRQQESRLDKANDDYAKARRQGLAKLRERADKKKEVASVRAEAIKELAKAKPTFEWRPPAVDGVVTPERPLPKGRAGGTVSSGPGGAAARQLRMAKLYISNGLPLKARPILTEIVAKFPDTAEAREAKALLATTPGLR